MGFRKVHFSYDRKAKHLSLEGIPDRDLVPEHTTQLILYNKKTFANLSKSSSNESDSEFQTELLHLTDLINLKHRSSIVRDKSIRIVDNTVELITRMFNLLSFMFVPLNWLFKGSAVAQHFREWRIIFKNGGEKTSMWVWRFKWLQLYSYSNYGFLPGRNYYPLYWMSFWVCSSWY